MASFLQTLFVQAFSLQPTTADTPDVPSPPRLPAEWEPHERTFIVWPTNNITDTKVEAVRQEIVLLTKAIAKCEPVVVLARPNLVDSAQTALGSTSTNIEVVALAIDGFWARDTAPVFTTGLQRGGSLTGVDFNCNGWYRRHQLQGIPKLAQSLLEKYNLPRTKAVMVAEGGALETDGLGTLLVTERSLVGMQRNPNMSCAEIEQELIRTLGVTKVIWLTLDNDNPFAVNDEGPSGKHQDSQARFLAPGVVALSRPHGTYSREYHKAAEILASARDSRGLPFTIVDIQDPYPNVREFPYELMDGLSLSRSRQSVSFGPSYLNFYIANGAVFVPQYGNRAADKLALHVLGEHFPGREVVPLRLDAIVSAGGGIHLATRNQPRCEAPMEASSY
ncbi:hypothetical protein CPC16_002145 [Podila verticillata]|nr:hypothetical protein CPC16_002145 [Podila verticillata]